MWEGKERNGVLFFRGPGEDNPCGAIEWAKQESSMVPLLSCNADMSSWLKDKYKGSGRGRPADKGSGSGGKKYISPFIYSYIRNVRMTFLNVLLIYVRLDNFLQLACSYASFA